MNYRDQKVDIWRQMLQAHFLPGIWTFRAVVAVNKHGAIIDKVTKARKAWSCHSAIRPSNSTCPHLPGPHINYSIH